MLLRKNYQQYFLAVGAIRTPTQAQLDVKKIKLEIYIISCKPKEEVTKDGKSKGVIVTQLFALD